MIAEDIHDISIGETRRSRKRAIIAPMIPAIPSPRIRAPKVLTSKRGGLGMAWFSIRNLRTGPTVSTVVVLHLSNDCKSFDEILFDQ
jgi:hypothetical protein